MGLTFSDATYARWASRMEPPVNELALMARGAGSFDFLPLITLVLAVSDEDEVWIRASANSVLDQAYGRLELRICDNGSTRPHVGEVLDDYAASDGRVAHIRMPEKRETADVYNTALSGAKGEFAALIDAGDELAPQALFEVVKVLQRTPFDAVYTDEDTIDVGGVRSDPVFKPYWSPELLDSTDYIGRLCLLSREVLEQLGGIRPGLDGMEEHDLMLRLGERSERILHVPKVLYHRRRLPSEGSPDVEEAPSRLVLQDAIARRDLNARIEPGITGDSLRLRRRVRGTPKVGVIVSVPAWIDRLVSVEELRENALHPVQDLVVAGVREDAQAGLDDVSHPLPARAANLASEKVDGEYLAFVDARVGRFSQGWLREMLREAQRPGVGAVGCRLFGWDGRTRHGGSVAELDTLTGFSQEPVYQGGKLLPCLDFPLDVAMAPIECMVVSRHLFELVGGFDDDNVPASFYGMDLCLRLRDKRRRSVYTPHSWATFGGSRAMPDQEEIAYVWRRWWEDLVRILHYLPPPLERHGLDGEALYSSRSAKSWAGVQR